MKRRPLFPKHAIGLSQTDYLRNLWCRHYQSCLAEADGMGCFLSCSICRYKSCRMSALSAL